MAGTIRFHLDEHVSSAVATGLHMRGVDVTMTAEVDLWGASDRNTACGDLLFSPTQSLGSPDGRDALSSP